MTEWTVKNIVHFADSTKFEYGINKLSTQNTKNPERKCIFAYP